MYSRKDDLLLFLLGVLDAVEYTPFPEAVASVELSRKVGKIIWCFFFVFFGC